MAEHQGLLDIFSDIFDDIVSKTGKDGTPPNIEDLNNLRSEYRDYINNQTQPYAERILKKEGGKSSNIKEINQDIQALKTLENEIKH